MVYTMPMLAITTIIATNIFEIREDEEEDRNVYLSRLEV